MFVHFSLYKCQYHKGQLTPFFIALIVILVTVILITVNISKVSLHRTYTSNAVDSGALAGATVMASVYDGLADSKTSMEKQWALWYTQMFNNLLRIEGVREAMERDTEWAQEQGWYAFVFYVLALIITVSNTSRCDMEWYAVYGLAILGAVAATFHAFAESNLRGVKRSVPNFKEGIENLQTALTTYKEALQGAYRKMRGQVNEAHESAVNIAYKMAFVNSGIGSKLDDDQREQYNDWLDDDDAPYNSGKYSWKDGQGRAHNVNVSVSIDSVGTYNWVVTTLTYTALNDLFDDAIDLCDELYDHIKEAYGDFHRATDAMIVGAVFGIIMALSCLCKDFWLCAIIFWVAWAIWVICLVIAMLYILYQLLTHIPDALDVLDDIQEDIQQITDGFVPRGSVGNPGDDEVLCYLTSVPHSHLVSVSSSQSHEGKNFGIWETTYPTVKSSAAARFGGATSSLSKLDYNANLISVE